MSSQLVAGVAFVVAAGGTGGVTVALLRSSELTSVELAIKL